MPNDLKAVIRDFAGRLQAIIEEEAVERAKSDVLAAFGVETLTHPRRARRSRAVAAKGRRKPRSVQLCPVPGCRNPAAPIFGMVCAKHKDVPKAKIRAYREVRRAKKARDAR
jgi:hypothetical protein